MSGVPEESGRPPAVTPSGDAPGTDTVPVTCDCDCAVLTAPLGPGWFLALASEMTPPVCCWLLELEVVCSLDDSGESVMPSSARVAAKIH